MIALNLQGNISKFQGKNSLLGFEHSKLKAAHPVNHFPQFRAKILRIAYPVNYSHLPPWCPCPPPSFRVLANDSNIMVFI